jgi:DNA-binding NarL/FixJ family response regulator
MIRLYVIEDHSSIIVPGLKRLFYSSRDGINVAGASESVEAAILEADPDSFDIFIFDLWLKNKLPVQNIQELVKHFPDKKIIVYTSEESAVWKQRMFKEGAMGYVIKNASRNELMTVIHKAACGENTINIKLEEQDEMTTGSDIPSSDITPGQQQIIMLLAKGLNHKEVAKIMNTSSSTIDKSLKLLRNQFNVKNNLELTTLCKEKGII